jgi:hypothetical protein
MVIFLFFTQKCDVVQVLLLCGGRETFGQLFCDGSQLKRTVISVRSLVGRIFGARKKEKRAIVSQ